jgi:hypothetical protein
VVIKDRQRPLARGVPGSDKELEAQPAAVASYRDSAYGLGVLTVTPAAIARITVFAGGPDLAASFGLA